MVRTHKSALLDEFLKEQVYVTTDLLSVVHLPDGELVQAPLVIEGIILDYDADFLLLGHIGKDTIELIKRANVVGVKQTSQAQEILDDPSTPRIGDMN